VPLVLHYIFFPPLPFGGQGPFLFGCLFFFPLLPPVPPDVVVTLSFLLVFFGSSRSERSKNFFLYSFTSNAFPLSLGRGRVLKKKIFVPAIRFFISAGIQTFLVSSSFWKKRLKVPLFSYLVCSAPFPVRPHKCCAGFLFVAFLSLVVYASPFTGEVAVFSSRSAGTPVMRVLTQCTYFLFLSLFLGLFFPLPCYVSIATLSKTPS